MMKLNRSKGLLILSFFALLSPAMAGCASSAGGETIHLRVLNSEDYINEGEVTIDFDGDEDGFEEQTFPSLLAAYEAYEKQVKGKNVRVIYDTFDTNETMLSALKTGKSTYDLICPSDYTIQKMMTAGMLRPFSDNGTPVYDEYSSTYLGNELAKIEAPVPDGNGNMVTRTVGEYSRGYMWGTLGLIYNPAKVAKDKGLEEDQVKFDMGDWGSLWAEAYHGEMSIKDSMRDTYSVGIMQLFDKEIRAEMAASGIFDESSYALLPEEDSDLDAALEYATNGGYVGATADTAYVAAQAVYSQKLASFFNSCSKEVVDKVQDVLMSLKENVFGFEVDSGKDDIVKGLVGINLAWSGDAVYSLNRGENEADQWLYYSVPKTGGNIWFDGWVMPESDSLHQEEAEEFVDFLSIPTVASSNMDYIGYTSFIAGDEVLDLVRQWYDPRSYAMYVWHDASKDPDCTWEDSDFVYDEDGELVYQDGTGVHENGDDYGMFDMTGSSYEEAVVTIDGVATTMTWEEYQELYNSTVAADLLEEYDNDATSEDYLAAVDEESLWWDVRDLTYMFSPDGSHAPGDTPDENPYLFYTDELEEIEVDGKTVVAGRQFLAQYPDQNDLVKLAVMNDYGENNKYVLTMWENVKGNNLPVWGVITFAIIILGLLAFILTMVITKMRYRKLKVARRKEAAARISK